MFKVATEPTFQHTIKARVPVDGGFRDESFKATYRVLEPEKIEAIDMGSTQGTLDFLRTIVVRLDDIGDAEGKAVEYSDEVLEQVLKLPYARRALITAYFEGVSGAKQGN
jgi:hypothetical protein